ncbi:hypothetical protein JEZ13_03935 [bacterium]|nr:hypothetical protein [bacterium]
MGLRTNIEYDIEQKKVIIKKICEIEKHIKRSKSNIDRKGSLNQSYKENCSKIIQLLQEEEQELNILENSIKEQFIKLNTSEPQRDKTLPQLFMKKKRLLQELDDLNQKIESETQKIVKDSLVIATTVTKSYTDKYIDSMKYDVIIVDEASMVPMPMLFWAVSKSRERTIIVGDFLQLPPICLSEYNPNFKKNIFDELKISNIELAEVKTKLLNTQYRMNPDIAQIINDHFYKNRLKNSDTVRKNVFIDDISNDNSLMFIDTSLDNPIATNIVPRSRVNLYHALLCISIAKMVIKRLKPSESIGILTPYNKQAKLINKILLDEKLNDAYDIKVNTIHSFQGGEETVIIFDSVEGNGLKSNWSMLNNEDYSECSNLLNVAITRAKSKLYIVGNYDFFKNNYPRNSYFNRIGLNLIESGRHTYSKKIGSSLGINFDTLGKKQKMPENILNDINLAEKEIIIISSAPTLRGVQNLQKSLKKLDEDISINIMINKYSKENKGEFYEIAEYIIVSGYKFKIIDKDNQSNLIFIDRKILWFGAFDILGLEDTNQFFRVEYPLFIKELINLMRLDDIIKGINGEKCPKCKSNYIETRVNHRNKQLYHACISTKCGYTKSL